mgnify:CR=1 FL=1
MPELITQTELSTFSRCEQRHNLRYNKWLTPFEESPALTMGSAFHAGIEALSEEGAVNYLRDNAPSTSWDRWESDAASIREATVSTMVKGALKRWASWPSVQEVQFEIPIRHPVTGNASKKHRFSGVFDGVWQRGEEHPDYPYEIVLGEWKTASVVNNDYIQRLEIDFQISTYMWAATTLYREPVRKVVYRIVKKPTIRQKKTESAQEYIERLSLDYEERPEHYFFEEVIERTDEQLAEWHRQAWAIHERILQIKRGGLPIKNVQSCIGRGRCPYFDHCTGHTTEDAFKKMPRKHRELKEKK